MEKRYTKMYSVEDSRLIRHKVKITDVYRMGRYFKTQEEAILDAIDKENVRHRSTMLHLVEMKNNLKEKDANA